MNEQVNFAGAIHRIGERVSVPTENGEINLFTSIQPNKGGGGFDATPRGTGGSACFTMFAPYGVDATALAPGRCVKAARGNYTIMSTDSYLLSGRVMYYKSVLRENCEGDD